MSEKKVLPGKHCLTNLQRSVQNLKEGDVLSLEHGIYHFYPEECLHKFYYVSNNDSGSRRIALLFDHKKNMILEGNGAKIVVHGRISPFVVDACEKLTIRNLTVTYSDKFYFQAEIIKKKGDELVLRPCDGFRYDLTDGIFRLYGENWENVFYDKLVLCQEFDKKLRRVAEKSPVVLFRMSDAIRSNLPLNCYDFRFSQLSDGSISVKGNTDDLFTEGNVLVFSAEGRLNDVFLLTESKDICLENVDILSAPGMGVICQLCENVVLKGVRVRTEEGDTGFISTDADATHFVHCTGQIILEDCVFEHMMDDASNIHGIYTTVAQIQPGELIAELNHYQQFGINSFRPGDTISVWKLNTTTPRCQVKVISSELIEPNFIKILVDDASGVCLGDLLENADRMPEVLIRGCRTGWNRPRGFLIATGKKAVVENCTFYNSECGIASYGYVNYWFESGGVRDLTIQNNLFEDCCYGCVSDGAAIILQPEAQREQNGPYFHHNIKILNNTFRSQAGYNLIAYGTDGIEYRGNRTVDGGSGGDPKVRLSDCEDVAIE